MRSIKLKLYNVPTLIGNKRVDIARRYWNTYDKTLHSHISFFGLSGKIFLMFGCANLFYFGLSQIIDKETFIRKYSWTPQASNKIFTPIKAQIASNNILNVAWTAPSIIVLGTLLERTYGSVFAFKVIFLTTFLAYASFSAMGGIKQQQRPWACHENGVFMGADNLATTLVWLTLLRFGLFKVTLPLAAVHMIINGPHYIGSYASALAIFLTIM